MKLIEIAYGNINLTTKSFECICTKRMDSDLERNIPILLPLANYSGHYINLGIHMLL